MASIVAQHSRLTVKDFSELFVYGIGQSVDHLRNMRRWFPTPELPDSNVVGMSRRPDDIPTNLALLTTFRHNAHIR